ncbi:unnamed protein product [Vitrella brassicaformis CCMP3155]|uniref:EF-hand domain-containing protein n=1 Tax=Vitrella brassicaformis (strain CCMP3155) TaxID=1169540 RepID=A0A0G4ELS9_VITBC|nr:unnamed protein product [Vitrella brassicaformis CCMP3155]|mmetsp:Transcript_8553/g.21083  ORF Transcript_8553/g.21083 Transcript_8553/m.21083 type:complete len:309 (-) Transcript_8553:172-1098(-)|eukprot:CEL98383.1 unnamed protein product [Vitrella brassicaformis CCMP3155]
MRSSIKEQWFHGLLVAVLILSSLFLSPADGAELKGEHSSSGPPPSQQCCSGRSRLPVAPITVASTSSTRKGLHLHQHHDITVRLWKAQFHQFDVDRSGVLEGGEVVVCLLRVVGASTRAAVLRQVMGVVDGDADKALSFPEFVGLYSRLTSGSTRANIQRFSKYDMTGDGRLNALELFLLSISRPHPFIMRLSNARAKMHQFDRDHDGFLDFNEYEDMALEDGLERQVEDAFRKYDQNGDTFISRRELQLAYETLGYTFADVSDPLLVEYHNMLDIDLDGFVSYSDFRDHSNAQFLEEQAGGLAVTEI